MFISLSKTLVYRSDELLFKEIIIALLATFFAYHPFFHVAPPESSKQGFIGAKDG